MKYEWSIVKRLKEKIGTINFDKDLGEEFISFLNAHDFDGAAEYLKKSKTVKDNEIEKQLVKHIETYKYAC